MDPKENLEKAIAYLEDLGARIKALQQKGLNTTEIRQEVFGEENPIAQQTQHQFSSENMIRSFLVEDDSKLDSGPPTG